jgi:hypothetical protein
MRLKNHHSKGCLKWKAFALSFWRMQTTATRHYSCSSVSGEIWNVTSLHSSLYHRSPEKVFYFLKKSIQFALKCNALTCNASMYSKTSIICITRSTCNITIALRHYLILHVLHVIQIMEVLLYIEALHVKALHF